MLSWRPVALADAGCNVFLRFVGVQRRDENYHSDSGNPENSTYADDYPTLSLSHTHLWC